MTFIFVLTAIVLDILKNVTQSFYLQDIYFSIIIIVSQNIVHILVNENVANLVKALLFCTGLELKYIVGKTYVFVLMLSCLVWCEEVKFKDNKPSTKNMFWLGNTCWCLFAEFDFVK